MAAHAAPMLTIVTVPAGPMRRAQARGENSLLLIRCPRRNLARVDLSSSTVHGHRLSGDEYLHSARSGNNHGDAQFATDDRYVRQGITALGDDRASGDKQQRPARIHMRRDEHLSPDVGISVKV